MALRGALGLSAEPVPPDRLLTGIAALTLLSEISERSPLLVIIDDAHLLDRSSLDVLSFVGRRLDTERVVLVLGCGGQRPWPTWTRASRSCVLSRCWRQTRTGYWTSSRIRLADVPAVRFSPRRPATPWP